MLVRLRSVNWPPRRYSCGSRVPMRRPHGGLSNRSWWCVNHRATRSSRLKIVRKEKRMEKFEPLLEQLLSQEAELQFRTFRNEDALSLGMKMVERAKADGKS